MSARGCFACWALLLALACADEPSVLRAPSEPRAMWILEPRQLGIGQVSVLERVVVTPPQFAPRPFVAPEALPGLSVLDAQVLPTEQFADRWIHRTRVRLRARAVGDFKWPESSVPVEGTDGSVESLSLPEISIGVQSILPEFAARSAPFGLRQPEPAAADHAPWGPALAGALAALACVGLVTLARRRLRRAGGEPHANPAHEVATAPWHAAHTAIERAAALGECDPLAAAHALSPALRRYLATRYGADTRGRTAEELRATDPPFVVRSNWPSFTALVCELDGLRFQAADAVQVTVARELPRWLDAAARCIDATTPPEHRQ